MNFNPSNEPLYPTDRDEVNNPMRSDLDGGGYKIFDLGELDLTGTGAITGVNTINGQAYPPSNLPGIARPISFNFPIGTTIFGDGNDHPIFTIYDTTDYPTLRPLFVDPNVNVILLTMPVNISKIDAGTYDQGKIDFRLYINYAASATQASGQYIITPYYASSPDPLPPPTEATEMMNVVTLVFVLVNGVDYVSSASTLNIQLHASGGYNYTYSFNRNSLHPSDSQPTVCNAVGFH